MLTLEARSRQVGPATGVGHPFAGDADQVAGLTCWEMGADPRTQIKKAGRLHTAGPGTAAVFLVQDHPPSPEEIVDLLSFAWKSSEVARLRFLRIPHHQAQLLWREG